MSLAEARAETERMSVAFVTELNIRDVKEFATNKQYPESMRKAVFLEYLEFCKRSRERCHEDHIAECEKQIGRMKTQIDEAVVTIAENRTAIPEIEKTIAHLRTALEEIL